MTLQSDRYWAAFFADTRRRTRLRRVALMTRDYSNGRTTNHLHLQYFR